MTNKQAAIKIIKRLRRNGFQALLAGGCVRDMLLGQRAKDYDVATDAQPKEVIGLFRRTLKVGAKFGVIIVLIASLLLRYLPSITHLSMIDSISSGILSCTWATYLTFLKMDILFVNIYVYICLKIFL